jgi:hypothetical protein
MPVKISFQDNRVNRIDVFYALPWQLDEYHAAVKDDGFFKSIESMLCESTKNITYKNSSSDYNTDANNDKGSGKQTDMMRTLLVSDKFYFAGRSARWMFEYKPCEVKSMIDRTIACVRNVVALIDGTDGLDSDNLRNLLMSSSDHFFMSQYVAKKTFEKGMAAAVRAAYNLADRVDNPALTQWIVEMDRGF